MIRYVTRPTIVDAHQWLGPNSDGSAPAAPDWLREEVMGDDARVRYADTHDNTLVVRAMTGEKLCRRGDWIIRMPLGALDVCSGVVFDLFYQIYEED